jgi:hypothetical protein
VNKDKDKFCPKNGSLGDSFSDGFSFAYCIVYGDILESFFKIIPKPFQMDSSYANIFSLFKRDVMVVGVKNYF